MGFINTATTITLTAKLTNIGSQMPIIKQVQRYQLVKYQQIVVI